MIFLANAYCLLSSQQFVPPWSAEVSWATFWLFHWLVVLSNVANCRPLTVVGVKFLTATLTEVHCMLLSFLPKSCELSSSMSYWNKVKLRWFIGFYIRSLFYFFCNIPRQLVFHLHWRHWYRESRWAQMLCF